MQSTKNNQNTVLFHSALETAEAKFKSIQGMIAAENELFIDQGIELKAKKRKVRRLRFLRFLLLGEIYEQKMYDISKQIHQRSLDYVFTIQELSDQLNYVGRFIARIKRTRKKNEVFVYISEKDSEFFNFDISDYLYTDSLFHRNRVD